MSFGILVVHLLQIIVTIFSLLLVIIPCVTSLSFNFTNFTPNDHYMVYEKSAYPTNKVIQLTQNSLDPTSPSIGRATYAQPLYLWDRASGNLTDFTTSFSFVIKSMSETWYSSGLAFFLAPNGSTIPENSTASGYLGLTTKNQSLNNNLDNPFVAVEFDILQSSSDPPCNTLRPNGQCNHVGIDISSTESATSVRWSSDVSIRKGMERTATISYDSGSRNLSVVFTGDEDIIQSLSNVIDLKEYLPEFVTFGFSAATMYDYSALFTIDSWSFSSTLEVDPGNEAASGTGTPNISRGEHGNETASGTGINSGNREIRLIIGLVVGGSVLLVITGLIVYFFWKNRKGMLNEVDESVDVFFGDEFDRGNGPKKFVYHDLNRATNNFAEKEKLGEGGFGGVYKGYIKETDSYIAVKRVSRGSMQGIKEYVSEVKIISRLRHKNLVQLLGWCHEKQELLLVYELMPNGSLDFHLFKGKSLLNWETRFKIAQGLASALLYLHELWEQCVVHRDIKSSNVMLDAKFNAKLGDFGLARLVDHEKGSQTTVLAGTMGYMAPECAITGKASKETDVFSFGVVALEIASGRRSIDPKVEFSRVNLVDWIWRLYGTGKILDASDPQLGLEFYSREMEQLMIVGLWCAHPDSNMRPSIREAIRVLNFEAPLPVLPLRMPVPMYCVPSLDMHSQSYGTTVSGSTYTVSSLASATTSSSKFIASSPEACSPSTSLTYSK